MDKYLDQWARVNRWYFKLTKFYDGDDSLLEDNERIDFVRAFFIECYHLKDWLKVSHPELASEVETLFNKQEGAECFKICADVANGAKHLDLTGNVRIDKNSKISTQGVRIRVSTISVGDLTDWKPPVCHYNWNIIANGKKYDVKEVAEKCVSKWISFLTSKSLSFEIVSRLDLEGDTSYGAVP